MLAAFFNGPHVLNIIDDYTLPKLEYNEVLIQVDSCGVCGTDFHIFEGKAPAKNPVILGHEYVGEIVEIGKEVSSLKIGDHVAINPNIHCGYCNFCKKGFINLCSNLKALGVTLNGGFAQYSIVPVSQVYLLPKKFPFDSAAYTEPLSCCVHGINQAEIKLNDVVLIVGMGTIGLLMVQLARLKGAQKIIAVDISDTKSDLSKKLGADYFFNSNNEDVFSLIYEITTGGADIVIECVGKEDAVQLSLNLVKKGGKVVIFGLASADSYLILNLQQFFHKEISIISSLLNPFTFQTAVDLLVSNKITVDSFRSKKILLNSSDLTSLFNGFRDSSIEKFIITPNN